MKLYTYTEAARLLSLSGRMAIFRHIQSLAARGEPLNASELLKVGRRRFLTDRGLERLRNFTPRKAGRKPKPTTEE